MMYKKLSLIFFIFFILQKVYGQNINGFQIYVSKDKLSSVTFHSEVTNWYFEEKNPPFKVSTLGANALMLQTSQEVKTPYNLVVAEGGRKHKFIVLYKDDIDLSEQDPDYSDLKQLTKLVNDFNNNNQQQATTQNNPGSDQNTNFQNTNTNTQLVIVPNTAGNDNAGSTGNDKFYAQVEAADKAKNNQQFQDAKEKYEQALQLKPDNSYVQSQLQEIKKAIDDQSGLKYNELITKANNAFSANRYDEALKFYNDALAIKPTDAYSAGQIRFIQKKQEAVKAEEANNQRDSLFNSYISAGDKSLISKSYDDALIAYNAALKIKPDDAFAASKISSVKQKKYTDSVEANNKAMDDLYNSFLNSGNKNLQEKLYDDAKIAFTEALKIKPGDPLATAKLNSIKQQQLSDSVQAQQAKLQTLHDTYIKSADDAFKNNLYDIAKNNYTEAVKLNATDTYAKNQIKKIDDALENIKLQAQKNMEAQQNAEHEKQYTDIIKVADNYYNSEMYTDAKAEYLKALAVNKTDLYSKNKISRIDDLLKQQKEKTVLDSVNNVKYTNVVLKADEYFNNKDYANAKSSYLNALKYKSEDVYAKDKLNEIAAAQQEMIAKTKASKDSIAKRSEITKQFNILIAKAKAAYSNNDFIMARGFYVSANNLNPDEKEPVNKIADIDAKLNELAVQKQQKEISDSLITAGEAALVDSDFNAALHNFSEALKLNQADQVYYINKQISFAQKQLVAKDSMTNLAKKEDAQQKELDATILMYKQGKDALKILDYNNALLYFKQFVSTADSLGLTSDQYNLASLLQYSKSKINDIQAYLVREKNKDTTTRKLPPVSSLPSTTIIVYSNPKDPALNFIYKKYPDIDFNSPPKDQRFDTVDISQENKLRSKDIMSSTSKSISENSSNGVKVICESIINKESKLYIKLLIQNAGSTEFLTGSMFLTDTTKDNGIVHQLPVYISGYPIILSGKEKTVVYVTRIKEISDSDNLGFEVTDRLNKVKINIAITGYIYNQQKIFIR